MAVPKVKQTQTQWCWAAANQSAIKYLFGTTYSQCSQANNAFGYSTCCNSPVPSYCNKPNSLESVQYINSHFKGISGQVTGPLSWSNTTQEIGTYHRPFLTLITWRSGGGHVLVARGYESEGVPVQQWINVMDPWDALYKEYGFAYFTSNSTFYWNRTLWRYSG